jgi:hypothetical protein
MWGMWPQVMWATMGFSHSICSQPASLRQGVAAGSCVASTARHSTAWRSSVRRPFACWVGCKSHILPLAAPPHAACTAAACAAPCSLRGVCLTWCCALLRQHDTVSPHCTLSLTPVSGPASAQRRACCCGTNQNNTGWVCCLDLVVKRLRLRLVQFVPYGELYSCCPRLLALTCLERSPVAPRL